MPEPLPRGGAGESLLGAAAQLLELLFGIVPSLLGQQTIERVLQMPFALLQLGLRPALCERGQHAAVGVADDPLGLTRQGAKEGPPVARLGARERLCQPEPRPASVEAHAAEDVEGDPARRDPPTVAIKGPHPEG